jgi:hypothetical protein
MKGLSKVIGRGLLVLALGCVAAACGDDDDHPAKDAGPEAGSGGAGGTKAGTGGTKAGTGGKGGSAGDASASDCADTAKENSGNMASDKCTSCLCGMKATETSACTADCWKLAYCVAAHCDASDTNCIIANCADAVGGAANLATVGALARATPFTACSSMCFTTPPPVDGSTDGGN